MGGILVNIAWPRVLRENTGRGYDLRPGNLGDALRGAAIAVGAGGGPLAAAVATGSDGIAFSTPPGDPLPAGRGARRKQRACLFWDAGSDIKAADGLIGRMAAEITGAGGRLLICSPSVDDQDYARGARLAPVVLWGPGVPAGVLYSPSTRQAGLVTNTDFAPSVADSFGLERLPVQAFGHAWQVRDAPDALGQVMRLERGAYRQARGMRILPYIAAILGAWMLLGAVLAVRRRMPPWMPLAPVLVILALLAGTSAWAASAWLAGLSVGAVLLSRRMAVARIGLWGTALAAALLLGDLCLGDPLMHHGLLGYSAVEGARYYGMGNEAMGVLVAACLIVAAALWGRAGPAGRIVLGLGLLCVAALLGSPSAGAKAGGILVSVAAFGTLLFTLSGGRWSPRAGLTLAAAVLFVLAAVAVGDAVHGSGPQSHIGQAIVRIHGGGLHEATDTIRRKLAVEGRLLSRSAWACALWGGLMGVFLLARRANPPRASAGRALMSAGAMAVGMCLLVNDAGVVAGALCATLLWCRLAAQARGGIALEPAARP